MYALEDSFFTLEHLYKAWEKVRSKSCKTPGVDGVALEDVKPDVMLPQLLRELVAGDYNPAAVKQFKVE